MSRVTESRVPLSLQLLSSFCEQLLRSAAGAAECTKATKVDKGASVGCLCFQAQRQTPYNIINLCTSDRPPNGALML